MTKSLPLREAPLEVQETTKGLSQISRGAEAKEEAQPSTLAWGWVTQIRSGTDVYGQQRRPQATITGAGTPLERR